MSRRAVRIARERAHPFLRHLRRQGPRDLFAHWRQRRATLCDGRFVGWDNAFALVQDLYLDFSKCRRAGSHGNDELLRQSFAEGLYIYERGCFQLDGLPEPFAYALPQHLGQWVTSLSRHQGGTTDVRHLDDEVFLAVTRYEYANLFHVLADLYNAFLVLRFLDLDRGSVSVLLMDGHPACGLDDLYRAMFADVRRVDEFRGVHRFKTVVFCPPGHKGPFLPHFQKRPYCVDDFRACLLGAFSIEDRSTKAARRITFVRRQEYETRPHDPDGPVRRQIINEDALIEAIGAAFPEAEVEGVRLERLDVGAQLRCIVDTDILIGMHGAGLTHALFLPQNAGLLELFPLYYSTVNDHYYNIAYWRRLHYTRWKNWTSKHEVGGVLTFVPPAAVIARLRKIVAAIEAAGP